MDESEIANQPTTKMRDSPGPDPDGDVILRCQDQDTDTTTSFQVSSKILRLASPVFVGMFSPCFREGQDLLQGKCPVIELEDDDASMMGLILNVLHYQVSDEDHIMDAKRLARLAIHCNKYDCIKALGPWVSVWFKNLKSMGQPATEEISEKALGELIPGFSVEWEEEGTLTLLPTSIYRAITIRIKRTLGELEAELQRVELLLRQSSKCYETSQLFCIECGRILPGQAKMCHPCHNSELPPRYCTSETRIAEYFAVLRKVELWPTATPFRMCSILDTTFRFICAKADLKHSCTGGTYCPLLENPEYTSKEKQLHGNSGAKLEGMHDLWNFHI
ncbi:hypothetical protein GQ44DRAFT_747278 [Phaeosphaeriaceae sp. PMI808]|nr:hypothetical protein GQ44DRAFT_747278 [Phaeosphaeriaceae sp. PMI808]